MAHEEDRSGDRLGAGVVRRGNEFFFFSPIPFLVSRQRALRKASTRVLLFPGEAVPPGSRAVVIHCFARELKRGSLIAGRTYSTPCFLIDGGIAPVVFAPRM